MRKRDGDEALLNPGLNSRNYSKAQLSAYCRSSWRYGLKPWEGHRWCARDDPPPLSLPPRPNHPSSYLLLVCSRQPEIRDFLVGVMQTTNSRYINTVDVRADDEGLGGGGGGRRREARAFHRHALYKGSVLIRYRARWRPYFPRERFSEPVGKTTTEEFLSAA